MSDRRFVLPEQNAVVIGAEAAEKLLQSGDGDAALLYIYIIKNKGAFSAARASAELGKSTAMIEISAGKLAEMGLLISVDRIIGRDSSELTQEELQAAAESDPAFPALVQESQSAMGRLLSGDELRILYGLYSESAFPPELIVLLIKWCMEEFERRRSGRMPGLRYIQRTAAEWERLGIYSVRSAEEYIERQRALRSSIGEVKKILGISDRTLAAPERDFIVRWMDMGFGPEAIELAYNRTVLNTGKLAWPYMDRIISKWAEKGLLSVDRIKAEDRKLRPKERPGDGPSKPREHSVTAADMDKLRRMREKIRGSENDD
ncbi:MAG: DnaD domain protein [Oscillospiraceae bacterium]|nr:DnaD domain protein [Oscillospiraceae bacterium]